MPPSVQERECKQANPGGKKGHVLESEEWALIKDRQHIGNVASTAFILLDWLLDLQLRWVSSSSEISIEALTPFHAISALHLWLHCHDTLCLWADWRTYQAAPKARDVQLFNGFLPCAWCSHDFDVQNSCKVSSCNPVCCFDYDYMVWAQTVSNFRVNVCVAL